ncbi:hypothetical protein Tco_0929938 [Tanacetum coccineum]
MKETTKLKEHTWHCHRSYNLPKNSLKFQKAISHQNSLATDPKKPKPQPQHHQPLPINNQSVQYSHQPTSTEEPTGKSKRVKRPAKKSIQAPARGFVIRETPEMPVSKKNEKVDVARGKGNDYFEHETNEFGFESDQEEDDEKIEDDEEGEEEEIFKTPSNDSDDEDETKIADKAEVDADKGFVQEEGTDASMTNKTKVLVSSSSRSSDLAAKFLNFSDIPTTEAEIVSLDVPVHHEVPSQQTPTLLTVPVLL